MKLDRTFITRESTQVSRELITRYLESKGYKQQQLDSGIVYERGSGLGSLLSFSTKQWKVAVTIQTHPNIDQTTNVVVTFNINTTGQLVTKKERNFWEKELDDLVVSANGFNADISSTAKIEERLRLEKSLNDGANWFYLIAVLSIINSIIYLVGGNLYFLVGLGISQLIDGVAVVIAEQASSDVEMVIKILAFTIDLLVACVFVLFGYFSRRYKWVFVFGMIVYALDGLLFLIGPDLLSIGFHIVALFMLYNGFKAFKQIEQSNSALPV
jgi:hypothetical protein